MRISDWSSDVCSSDLVPAPPADPDGIRHFGLERRGGIEQRHQRARLKIGLRPDDQRQIGPIVGIDRLQNGADAIDELHHPPVQIGSASWRESMCNYV